MMGFLDPWAKADEHVRRMQIADPYDRFFRKRADVIADLFEADAHSIDAIALAGISLGALAEARFGGDVPPYRRKERNQICFRLLLTEHCPDFTNRTSVPEVLQACVRDRQFPRHEENLAARYASRARRGPWTCSDDPLADDFTAWADAQKPRIPDLLRAFDYAGCIHKYYRNAVIHDLRVAGGRDIDLPDDRCASPIFYTEARRDGERGPAAGRSRDLDTIASMRFCIQPPYLLDLLRQAIRSVREWALLHDRNLFTDGEDEVAFVPERS